MGCPRSTSIINIARVDLLAFCFINGASQSEQGRPTELRRFASRHDLSSGRPGPSFFTAGRAGRRSGPQELIRRLTGPGWPWYSARRER